MGLSRNKVAVPEGAAGTPPFWRDDYSYGAEKDDLKVRFSSCTHHLFNEIGERDTLYNIQGWPEEVGSTPHSPPCLQGKKIFDILTQAKL